MGRNKAFLQLPGGETMIQRIIRILKPTFSQIIIVTNQKEFYSKLNVQVEDDLIKESGPLGGIFTGLCYSTSKFNFVVACDMPFIQPALIRLLLDESGLPDVVIPEVDGKVEPLFAVYSKNCLPAMFEQLQKGNLKIRRVLDNFRVKKIRSEEIDRLDPQHLSFVNINTEEDLKKVESLNIKKSEVP